MSGAPVPPVYVIGARWRHHARHSGYDHFAQHVGIRLTPIRLPLLPGRRGRRADARLTAAMAGTFMRIRRAAMYHLIDGDRDLRLVAPYARQRGSRLIATFHNPPVELAEAAPDNHIRHDVEAVILVSESQREYFSGLLAPERIFVAPHGIDTTFFRPATAPAPSSEPYLITVGAKHRDWDTLTETLALLWRDHPRLRLLAVGAPDEARSRLKRFGGERVATLQRVSDRRLRRAYQHARMALFAFSEATANNSLLEAMACGAPVVATDVGGVREYTGDQAAILVPPGDPAALAKAVARVLDDETLAERVAAAGRERALEYDYAVVARAIGRIYGEVAMLTASPRARDLSA